MIGSDAKDWTQSGGGFKPCERNQLELPIATGAHTECDQPNPTQRFLARIQSANIMKDTIAGFCSKVEYYFKKVTRYFVMPEMLCFSWTMISAVPGILVGGLTLIMCCGLLAAAVMDGT